MTTNYCQNNDKLYYRVKKSKIVAFLLAICFSLSLQAQDSYYCLKYYEDGEISKTIECLNDYLKRIPKDVDALAMRAICYEYVDEYVWALSDYTNAIKYHHKKAKYTKDRLFKMRGKVYADIENYNEALKDYAAALKINSKNTDVLFERANLYYDLDNYAASDADWRQILKINKDNVNAQIGLARNMIERGQVDEAIRELDRLEKVDSRNPYIYRYRSNAFAVKENYRKAIDDLILWCYYDEIDNYKEYLLSNYAAHEFTYAVAKVSEMIIKEKDDNRNWYYLRVSLYEDRDMYREAINDFNIVEQLLPSPVITIFIRRGRNYSNLGEYDKAIADFDEGLKLRENDFLYLYRAEAKRLKGDYQSAIADFTKAIELDPMDSYAYYKRGWTKEFDKDFQGALKDYSTSIDLDKEYAYTYVTRGRLYQLRLNQPQLAEKDFQSVLALENDITKSGNCRQYALFHLGRTEEAIAHQNAILEKHPTSGNYYDATCLYSLMNRPTDAIKFLQQSFEMGFRSFIHLENDTDLDNIRSLPEFIELINLWKQKVSELASQTSLKVDVAPRQTQLYVVKTKELRSGVYEIPCTVNDLPLRFIFDTGASDITISSLEAAFMLKNNYLNEYDFRDRRNYRTASGDIVEGTKVRLRSVKVGELELNNIEASVVHSQNAPLLFGQSALGKLVKITIDNKNNEIVFEH